MSQQYKDPIIQKYIDLMKASVPEIKEWFQGDPLRVAASQMPLGMISKTETRVGHWSNAEDEHGIELQITIITDVRHELSTSEDERKTVAGVAKLYELMEGRDETTYALKSNSILDVLRSNREVDATYNLRTDLNTVTRVEYGETLRDREEGVWSIEARLTFVAHFVQNR